MYNADLGVGCNSSSDGCQSGGCSKTPDLCMKRHDTRPSLKISMEDCDGVVDLTDENLVLEASMWFDAKIKSAIDESSEVISFADGVGFDQVLVGDVIVMDRVRSPERMLVAGIDESSKLISVERAYDGTSASSWPKGNALRAFRFMDASAAIESVYEDVTQVDGTTANELTETFLVFDWYANHTSMPGCYWLEFKLIMMSGQEVEWVKRLPLSSDGFLVSILDSPTVEI